MTTTELHLGDCRQILQVLPAQSVNCCVTSPPYFGLRDYGMANQIGLEQTHDAYVAELVAVFREVRRVLRDDGTLWLNLGDSYCSIGGEHTGRKDNQQGVGAGNRQWKGGSGRADKVVKSDGLSRRNRDGTKAPGLKPKDLIGIPWRVAFALQADGWWLRQDIIWHKPNPMPESVTDRCTKAHEYIFLLSKSARYWYDAEAIKSPSVSAAPRGGANAFRGQGHFRNSDGGPANRNGRDMASIGRSEHRNRRSVWTVATQPYKGAHFATFPPKLVEPCILAGCPVGGTVLDPFSGSGTTGQVAINHHRSYIGCELNPDYHRLANQRLNGAQIGLPLEIKQ
jgi:DNA modification methylase